MGRIVWQDYMSIDQGVIDSDHKKLFKYLSDLEDILAAGQGKEAIQKVVDDLVGYTNEHFDREDVLWEQNGADNADLRDHRAKHQRLRDMVKAYIYAASQDAVQVGHNLHTFLSNWLLHHIVHEDAGMARKIGITAQKK
jgi:hemerythrin-like metal-binding protein